jgi:hypothetical protein
VSDLDAMRALVQRYARAADRRDVDALAALFHPEATLDGARGAQSLDQWLDTMRAPRSFPVSMHVLSDPLITYEPGADHAALDTYAVVYQLGEAADGDLTLGINYLDQVVRQGDGWVIRARVSRTLWMR